MMQSELFLDVRYYETDQMGIVHHSNYVRYFECGRTDMLKKLGLPIEKIEEAGVMLPVVSVVFRWLSLSSETRSITRRECLSVKEKSCSVS